MTVNTDIELNTTSLRAYADRLNSINKRVQSLDGRMNELYQKTGLRDVWNLIQANSLKGNARRITDCEKYLDDTASDFDSVEREITNLF